MQQNNSSRQTCKKKAKLLFESSLLKFACQSHQSLQLHFFYQVRESCRSPPQYILGQVASSSLDEDKAKLFNHYFFSVFTHSSYQLPSLHEVAHITPIDEICFDEHKVYEILISQDCNKAAGIDSIRPDVLKHCAMTKPLHHLFCHCIFNHNIRTIRMTYSLYYSNI